MSAETPLRRILVVLEFFDVISGVQVSVTTLVNYLKSLGFEVLVVAPFVPFPRDNGRIKVVRVPSLPPFGRIRVAWPWLWWAKLTGALAEIDAFRPDLVHIQGPYPTGFLGKALAKRYGVPLGLTYHTDLVKTAPWFLGRSAKVLGWLAERATNWAVRSCFAACSFIIAPSPYVTESLSDRWRRLGTYLHKVSVLPTPIPVPERPVSYEDARAVMLQRHGISRTDKMLLHVGRLSPEKNYPLLFAALQELAGHENIVLVLVGGGGHYARRLKRMVAKLKLTDRVIFTDEVPHEELDVYYAACDCGIMGSLVETQGMSPSETMGRGSRPVVAAKRGGVRYYLLHGEHGFLAEPTPRAFADWIRILLFTPALATKFGQQGRAYVREHLAPAVVYSVLLSLYEQAVSR